LTFTIKGKAVIATDNFLAFKPSKRKRQEPVPARVLESNSRAIRPSPKYHPFVTDSSGKKFTFSNLMAPSRRIPSIQGEASNRIHGSILNNNARTSEVNAPASKTRPTHRARFDCCARPTTGHADAPPSAAMNSRRRIQPSQQLR
jgi:hypothetical protein